MLHIRNTLLKHKYLENGTLSKFLTFTIVFYNGEGVCTSRKPTFTRRNSRLHTEPGGAENRILHLVSFFRANSQLHELHAPLFISV